MVILSKKFQELNHHDQVIMKVPDDVVTYKKFVTLLRIHIICSGSFELSLYKPQQLLCFYLLRCYTLSYLKY
ncbi:hypothetical protein SADUNF_Sadunf04G0071500 [Salix dunnii]|uniref:Uncharacterized protein n=1 Tax=Salix dunnii TaxID=1413687 RepID=A0A835MYX3_9ROSI|nr:hypothetical protein SADUNF_Sadunf04G0071500 [Salix dunnii]